MSTRRIVLKPGADLEGFRDAARRLVAEGVAPDQVAWSAADAAGLFDAMPAGAATPAPAPAPALSLPRAMGALVASVVCHRDPERYALLYRAIWRLLHGERHLLAMQHDPLVHSLERMAKSVRRDIHKMHAFLRFRRVAGDEDRYVAWFEPEHFILEAAAPFFTDRFPVFPWSILTPLGSLHWDRSSLRFGPPAQRADAPAEDAFEQGWNTYYESTFNPARVNPGLMRAHMPKKYWRNLPEAAAIPALIRAAPARVQAMIAEEAAMPRKRNPDRAVARMQDQEPASLAALNKTIAASKPLVPGATRAVLGEGPLGAAIAFVGEQPGDQEDLQGRPFVGPAGQLLDRAIAEAGIDRARCYLTNAVKHFKFEQRGKKRIHKRPTPGEVKHYKWWLEKELGFVRPRVVVALGATAVLALAGRPLPVTANRGPAQFDGRAGYITVHPSYLLRLPDAGAKQREYAALVRDLRHVKEIVEAMPRGQAA